MIYKQEYDHYMNEFNKLKQTMVSDSGDEVSKSLMIIEGINFRVGQILAELELEYSELFDLAKDTDMTDKQAKAKAELGLNRKCGISKGHFERMHKSFKSMIMSFKKRLRVLEGERQY